MQFLFSTGSLWSYSIERCFDLALQAGYDGLELLIDARWESRQIEYLLGLVQHYGLPIHAVHSPFIPNIPGWPLDPPGRLRKSIELAQELESSVVVHHLPARFGALWVQSPGRLFYVPVPRKSAWPGLRWSLRWSSVRGRDPEGRPAPGRCRLPCCSSEGRCGAVPADTQYPPPVPADAR